VEDFRFSATLEKETWRYCPANEVGRAANEVASFDEQIELTYVGTITYGHSDENEVGKGVVCASRRYTYG
jgi:hypothetical protein